MNLTEPHCGTDLGLIRSKAVKQPDGSYRISGTKIFISPASTIAENIVHLVLARTEGAPAGIRASRCSWCRNSGPRRRLARRSQRGVVRLDRGKMGIHGNATCVMNYDGATGWLIGEEQRGINAMFTMMNEARLAVGVQGRALRGRLSERRGLCEGPPAGPRAHRREISRPGRRSDHRPSRRARAC